MTDVVVEVNGGEITFVTFGRFKWPKRLCPECAKTARSDRREMIDTFDTISSGNLRRDFEGH